MLDYFTQHDPVFGRISWTMGLVWFVALVASVFLLTRWREMNPARRRFWQRWAIGTLALGTLGILALVLNAFQVPPFDIRAWMYLLAILTLAYWGWAAYFYVKQLPKQAAATRTSGRTTRMVAPRGTQQPRARVYDTATERPAQAPRPEPTTSRRESRRDRKRRSK